MFKMDNLEYCINLDSDQSIFFKRQLEYIKAKTYDIKYPSLNAMTCVPVSSEAGEGAETITYDQYDSTGIVKFISDYSNELPRSDVKGKEFTISVRSLGGSYGWSLQEIRNAAFARKNLTTLRAAAARKSNDQMQNKIGFLADGSADWAGLYGLIYNPNVTKTNATNGTWLTGPNTPDEIIADINLCINKIDELTNGVEKANTVLISPLEYTYIQSTPRTAYYPETILDWVKRTHPGVTFMSINEMKAVTNPITGSGSVNVMVAYTRDPDYLQYELPVIYEQLPVQEKALAYMVPVHSRVAGVNIYYPLSVHVVVGI